MGAASAKASRPAHNSGLVVKPAFKVHGISHRGLVRIHNEDSWFADGELGLAIVADGVGGHANGARASHAAVQCIAEYIRRATAMLGPETFLSTQMLERAIVRAISLANRRLIAANAAAHDAKSQCGTTIVGLWAPHGERAPAAVFHVGDSRMYLLREGELQALTRDHSVYQRWIDSGRYGSPPPKNYILQALGLSDVTPEIVSVKAIAGDHFLLCTDGLTNSVVDAELKDALVASVDADSACGRLVSLGLARGGNDNLTAVVCAISPIAEAQ